jgi:hypothetical protein
LIAIFAGQFNTGGVKSCTIMICWHVAVFPQASVALYVLVIIVGQKRPLLTSPIKVTVTEPQLSDAMTKEIFGAGTSFIHCTNIGPGQAIDGGVISWTVIV